jgi:hypothetical protein
MSDSKIFIPQLWEDRGHSPINVKEVTAKIITSNKYKYFILQSVPKETKVHIISCKLKHKEGHWVDFTSSAVTSKGGIVTIGYYSDYIKQTLDGILVLAEKYSLSDEDKVYNNMNDIVLYIESGSSDLRDFHEYINPNYWIQVKVDYLYR